MFRKLTQIFLVFVLTISGTLLLGNTTLNAEVVEVEGQGDCPGGNDGWQRHLISDIATKRQFTRCVRVEQVVVAPEPTPTPTPTPAPATTGGGEASPAPAPAPAPAPVTVSRVVGTDPYPSLSTGGEIPGTRTWSTNETSWAQFATTSMASGWSCPAIYGPNGDPYAAENNGFDSGSGKWFRVCVKNPWREPINPQLLANYETTKREAQAAALALSEQWNSENPGLQKCFQWGPLTSPTGGTESGGVCANVIGAPKSSTSDSTSDSKTVTTADSSTVVSFTSDPLPLYANGQEIPGTRVNGQVNISCPIGSGSAIEVNATTKAVFTYCTKNWTPTRVAQPNSDSSTATSKSESNTATAPQAESAEPIKVSPVETPTAVVSSDPIDFKGNIKQIADVLQTLEISNIEESAINNVTAKLASIKSTSKLVRIVLPNSPNLDEVAKSLTPSVCRISGLVVQPRKAGVCQIAYTFEGESGNSFETTKKITFKK